MESVFEEKMDSNNSISQMMVQTLKPAIRSNEAEPVKSLLMNPQCMWTIKQDWFMWVENS